MPIPDIVDSKVCSFVRDQERPSRPLPSPPSFPVHCLPEPTRSLVVEGAAAIGVPPDLIGVPLLAFAAGVIGRSRSLQLKSGWEEHPVLWITVVAPPGSAKTPSLLLAQHASEILQQDAYVQLKSAQAAYASELASWVATHEAVRGPKPNQPALQHIYTTDATVEAIAMLLQDTPGLVLVRDELVGWIKDMNAYRPGADRQKYLSSWSSTSFKVDRRSAEPILVRHPSLSVVGAIQPDLLPELHNEAGRRDGFIERILWSQPKVQQTMWSENVVAEQTQSDVVDVFRQLRARACESPPESVGLDPTAKAQWVDWFNENQHRTATARGIEQGMLAKLPSQAARLALVLHCLSDPDGRQAAVDGQTLASALDLAEYFLAHARSVLPAFDRTERELIWRVMTILTEVRDWVARRELHKMLGGRVRAATLDAALEELAGRGLVEQRVDKMTGGRPSEEWRAMS